MKRFLGNRVATDVILEYEEKGLEGLILIERKYEPFGFALAGGNLEPYLGLKENSVKETKEETNLDITQEGLSFFGLYDAIERDPRGRMISAVYVAKASGTYKQGSDSKAVHFFPHGEMRTMLENQDIIFAFDHRNILREYYAKKDAEKV